MDLPAHRIAKVSGIGCSSKAPTYFLSRSHGFNSVHGRMPSVTTGANLANRDLVYIGVSGDGDTASIGLGQFCHAVRRRVNMTYIVMNNGCYGLTKGQFSATNDKTSPSKKGEANPFEAIDLCQMAIQLGAGFVARSFSGDKTQLIPLIKAAISYNGFAFLDVISPCVTFNNHPTSTKSYDYVRAHNMASENKLDYVEPKEEITVDYAEGTSATIDMHDGSRLVLNKLDKQHDPRDADAAIMAIRSNAAKGAVATGLLYINEHAAGHARHPGHRCPPAQRRCRWPSCARARRRWKPSTPGCADALFASAASRLRGRDVCRADGARRSRRARRDGQALRCTERATPACHRCAMAACANADCRPALEVDMKLLGAALLGLVVGVLGSWMYMDGRLQPALQRIVQAESARDLSAKAAKVFEDQLQGAKQAADKFQAAVKAAEQAATRGERSARARAVGQAGRRAIGGGGQGAALSGRDRQRVG